jgi:hypothetical protein
MRFRFAPLVLAAIAVIGFTACSGSGSEPSESDMKDAMLQEMNHPPGDTTAGAPITITFFKKEACDPATAQGFHCTFDVKVSSSNLGASMYNNIPGAEFYKDKDSGKWAMRPPF